MKLVNFKIGQEIRLGIKNKYGVIDVKEAGEGYSCTVPTTMEEIIAGGEKILADLAALAAKNPPTRLKENLVYLPCITKPEKILCVGLNYVSRSKECKIEVPASPIIFSKFNNALAGHQQMISLPKNAQKIDYEAELVIVIGKEACNVSKENALSYVFGYTVGNDLSARDLQFRTGQWLLGKTCDHFAPIGPFLVTADEVDPTSLAIQCTVNGEIRQSANTKDFIFDCAMIVSYLSQHMTLKPGDIIFSGTPSGVILDYPEEQQVWLKPGDVVTVSIENVGTLINTLK